jgi:hypothetical protein
MPVTGGERGPIKRLPAWAFSYCEKIGLAENRDPNEVLKEVISTGIEARELARAKAVMRAARRAVANT